MKAEPLSEDVVAELRRLYEAATPGEWHVGDDTRWLIYSQQADGSEEHVETDMGFNNCEDRDLVVAVFNALPALLDAVSTPLGRVEDQGSLRAEEARPPISPRDRETSIGAMLKLAGEVERLLTKHADLICDVFDHEPDDPICTQGNFGSNASSREVCKSYLRRLTTEYHTLAPPSHPEPTPAKPDVDALVAALEDAAATLSEYRTVLAIENRYEAVSRVSAVMDRAATALSAYRASKSPEGEA